MLEVIEKLLILQDRDRRVAHLEAELGVLGPQRHGLQSKAEAAQTALDAAKFQVKHLESERKKLELEVEAHKQRIEKYALQQFQTKKNEEYRALAHEIETCKKEIVKLEDEQLTFMEQAETAQKTAAAAVQAADLARRETEKQVADLNDREQTLRKLLAEAVAGRAELAAGVDPSPLQLYERLRRSKGERVVVGVDHGACGGCHMKLPAQVVLACRGGVELVACPNCGRILYYTREMDMVVAE